MKIVWFTHSLISDWNHGNAHFLRGVVRDLLSRGHEVVVYEPVDGWSLGQLIAEHGDAGPAEFRRAFGDLESHFYDERTADLDDMVAGADAVIVHEWNPPELVAAIGAHRTARGRYALLFHDTHHRSASAPDDMGRYDLAGYDGVLAFGEVIREIYTQRGWARDAWTWHEAADVTHYRPPGPLEEADRTGDLVWIGNWGDGERADELEEFLLEPVRRLGLRTRVRGVRYPDHARRRLAECGIDYAGWASAATVVEEYARHRMTVHVPRRLYRDQLPGIPTIRVFETLACGIPLICAPWDDAEHLFTPGEDYLVARDGHEMLEHMHRLLEFPAEAAGLARRGLATIRARHTCAHRVDELLSILASLGVQTQTEAQAETRPQSAKTGPGRRAGSAPIPAAASLSPAKKGSA